MPKQARIGDAISHGGVIIQGSPDTSCNGIPLSRITDAVMCVLHGPQVIVTGSPNTTTNGLSNARIGDLISCGAKIVSGSPNTDVN